jgi:hypothetical protein
LLALDVKRDRAVCHGCWDHIQLDALPGN